MSMYHTGPHNEYRGFTVPIEDAFTTQNPAESSSRSGSLLSPSASIPFFRDPFSPSNPSPTRRELSPSQKPVESYVRPTKDFFFIDPLDQ